MQTGKRTILIRGAAGALDGDQEVPGVVPSGNRRDALHRVLGELRGLLEDALRGWTGRRKRRGVAYNDPCEAETEIVNPDDPKKSRAGGARRRWTLESGGKPGGLSGLAMLVCSCEPVPRVWVWRLGCPCSTTKKQSPITCPVFRAWPANTPWFKEGQAEGWAETNDGAAMVTPP